MKALIHIVPRGGAENAFESRIREVANALREKLEGPGAEVNVMLRLREDPFGPRTPHRGALEITGETVSLQVVESAVAGIGDFLEEMAHPDLSTMLVGEDVAFLPADCAPVRYQYLMRRNASFDHDAYLKRYREIHSQFGMRVPGIVGYVQFHVDPHASQRLAERYGLGVWDVDSVSELHLESLDTFLAAVAESPVGAEAAADEEVFVDRANSYDFCSTVERTGR